jgi:antitoxin component HigA of HigAB toxin-antitoxin module
MIISMDIKPIKTELDYQAALKEIEALMYAYPETPRRSFGCDDDSS